jgi:hypothetical protein
MKIWNQLWDNFLFAITLAIIIVLLLAILGGFGLLMIMAWEQMPTIVWGVIGLLGFGIVGSVLFTMAERATEANRQKELDRRSSWRSHDVRQEYEEPGFKGADK